MKVRFAKTTKVTRPNPPKRKYAPQTPDTNNPDLGRPAPKVTKPKKNKTSSKS